MLAPTADRPETPEPKPESILPDDQMTGTTTLQNDMDVINVEAPSTATSIRGSEADAEALSEVTEPNETDVKEGNEVANEVFSEGKPEEVTSPERNSHYGDKDKDRRSSNNSSSSTSSNNSGKSIKSARSLKMGKMSKHNTITSPSNGSVNDSSGHQLRKLKSAHAIPTTGNNSTKQLA